MTIEVSSTDRRDGKALALFARHEEWQKGHTKSGRSFFAIPGSQPNLFHMTDQNDCSCPDRQRSRNLCKHIRAVRLWMAMFLTGAVSPKKEAGATPEDDRIAITPEGAAFLAQQRGADRPLASDDEIELMFAVVAAADQARREARFSAIFGEDDDKPFCSNCNRHHARGQHYAKVIV